MGGTTPRLTLPYPVGGDTPDVPRDVKALADKLDIATALDSHGTLAARPAAGLAGRYYTDDATGITYRDSGSAWAPLGDVPAVLALPASPVNGQEVSLLADATAGIVWRFKFRAGSASTYKWEFLGGSPLYLEGSNKTLTSGGGTLTTLVGPLVMPALAGDYLVEGSCALGAITTPPAYGTLTFSLTRGATGSVALGGSGTMQLGVLTTSQPLGAAVLRRLDPGQAASTQYWLAAIDTVPTAHSIAVNGAALAVRPVRVG